MRIDNKTMSSPEDLEIKKQQLLKACRDFESVFTAYLLKSMRASIIRAEEPDNTRKMYEDMFDEAVAREISLSGSLGLGDILYKQLLPLLEQEVTSRGEEK